jgi:hypothetical protein
MKQHNQTDRYIINTPIAFTYESLTVLVAKCNGWENQPDLVKQYVDNIIEKGRLELNPSHELGDGANVNDVFSLGFMVYMKKYFDTDVDPSTLWWHPMSEERPKVINDVSIETEEIDMFSDHVPMTKAIDANTGKIVDAKDLQ